MFAGQLVFAAKRAVSALYASGVPTPTLHASLVHVTMFVLLIDGSTVGVSPLYVVYRFPSACHIHCAKPHKESSPRKPWCYYVSSGRK